jgi:hypothetical protein
MSIKPIKGFPTVEEIESRIAKEPLAPDNKTNRARVLLIILGLLVLGLAIVRIVQSEMTASLLGSGAVIGSAVDGSSSPVKVEISVLKTDLAVFSDDQGLFQLTGIPAGEVRLIVAYQGQGYEVPAVVRAGGTTDLGIIKVLSTQTVPNP